MGQMTFSERLQSSYQQLTQIENWTEQVHYQNYIPETHKVVFQRYIQGYPVIFSSQQSESDDRSRGRRKRPDGSPGSSPSRTDAPDPDR
ncbi:MAG: hypothetical protein U5K84_13350 [Alkalibacterium sp.]|nr:hypothetical protein [Alkalibacterium sp.]